jgi:tetratricopeptide (TPR) repeat protein
MLRKLVLLGSLSLAPACAHPRAGAAPSAPAPSEAAGRGAPLALEGAVVRGTTDPLTGLTTYDPALLFHLAAEAQRNDRLPEAVALYERLLAEFPSSALVPAARFNLGLVHERLGRFDSAAAVYRAAIDAGEPADVDGRKAWLDAHFRLAVCHARLGDAWRAVAVFDALLERVDLDDFDRLQALAGRGLALRQAGDLDSAESALSRALRFAEEAATRGLGDDAGVAGEAALAWAQLAADRFTAVTLAFPIEELRTRLQRKCELLLTAQHRYLRAIRLGNVETATTAGLGLGALYEALYDAIVGLEAPAELTDEEREVYRDEVRGRVGVLVKKAILIYEKSLLVGRTSESAAEPVRRLEAALDRLRALYAPAPASSAGVRHAMPLDPGA